MTGARNFAVAVDGASARDWQSVIHAGAGVQFERSTLADASGGAKLIW